MNPESQRIAIAEACGAKWQEDNFRNRMLVDVGKDRVLFIDVHGGFDIGLPDYLNDLNAMHEAEKVLDSEQCSLYFRTLFDVVGNSLKPMNMVHATATQRAEAFLRTLGLWKEEPVSEATVEGLR